MGAACAPHLVIHTPTETPEPCQRARVGGVFVARPLQPLGETIMGASTEVQWISVTPTLDTNAYADNDVLFNSVEIPNAVFAKGRSATLISITGHDKDDQAIAMDLLFSQAALTLGTINAAVDISDANLAAGVPLGHRRIATGDYLDLVNGQTITHLVSPGLVLEAAATTRSLYVAGINRGGTPTHAANGLVLNFGLIWH
jgi:hypothetical protein